MKGKIVKAISGFYYVVTEPEIVYECKAKGVFRNLGIKPLVGDDVVFDVTDEAAKTGNLIAVEERRNTLLRPAVANVDQALIIFAIVKPNPNFNLLDRFLIRMERQQIPCIICFNKADIATKEEQEELRRAYETCGFRVLFLSALKGQGMEQLMPILAGKTTTVAGPSGVGKSTIINYLSPEAEQETGEISKKIERGKHTTRHTKLLALGEDTFILDTPGFTSLDVSEITEKELYLYYPEFREYEPECRFAGCSHITEPDCGIKRGVDDGRISQVRYRNYCQIYQELKDIRRYK